MESHKNGPEKEAHSRHNFVRGASLRAAPFGIALLIAMAMLPAPATADATPCVYLPGVDSCEEGVVLFGDGARKTSFIAASGTTTANGATQWEIDPCVRACITSQTVKPEDLAAIEVGVTKDVGTLSQEWTLIYEGDAECVKITGDYWHSQGVYYLLYTSYDWLGDHSEASGSRATYIGGGYVDGVYVVDAEGSNQPECDGLRQAAMENTKIAAVFYANTHFGEWTGHGGGSAQFDALAASLCLVGSIASGIGTVSGDSIFTMHGGTLSSGTFKILGAGSFQGVAVDYSASGHVSVAC